MKTLQTFVVYLGFMSFGAISGLLLFLLVVPKAAIAQEIQGTTVLPNRTVTRSATTTSTMPWGPAGLNPAMADHNLPGGVPSLAELIESDPEADLASAACLLAFRQAVWACSSSSYRITPEGNVCACWHFVSTPPKVTSRVSRSGFQRVTCKWTLGCSYVVVPELECPPVEYCP